MINVEDSRTPTLDCFQEGVRSKLPNVPHMQLPTLLTFCQRADIPLSRAEVLGLTFSTVEKQCRPTHLIYRMPKVRRLEMFHSCRKWVTKDEN
eukprot:4271141-Amphidinium_carterae.1